MSVICVYCELGHLVADGRCETLATNSKLRHKKEKEKGVMTFFECVGIQNNVLMCNHTIMAIALG